MLEIKGIVNTAICYAKVIEDEDCHFIEIDEAADGTKYLKKIV